MRSVSNGIEARSLYDLAVSTVQFSIPVRDDVRLLVGANTLPPLVKLQPDGVQIIRGLDREQGRPNLAVAGIPEDTRPIVKANGEALD